MIGLIVLFMTGKCICFLSLFWFIMQLCISIFLKPLSRSRFWDAEVCLCWIGRIPWSSPGLDFYCHVNLDVLFSFLSSNCLRAAYALWWLCSFWLNAACKKTLWEPFRWWGECNCSFTYTSKVWQIYETQMLVQVSNILLCENWNVLVSYYISMSECQ